MGCPCRHGLPTLEPRIPAVTMGITVIENVIYGSALGAGLVADIALPARQGALPAIISIHGGRWIRGSRFDDGKDGRPNNGVIDLRQWAEAGYFAMRVDYRLVTCTPAPACFQDVMCAIRWVNAHATAYGIDPKRIFLIGQSAGGHMATLAATLGPDGYEPSSDWRDASTHFAAAISISGAYDLVSLDWGSGWCPAGSDWQIARRYASPIEHVNKSNKPMLIFHAEDDLSVPVAQADSFFQKLNDCNSTHVYHRYKTGGHLRIAEPIFEDCMAFLQNVSKVLI